MLNVPGIFPPDKFSLKAFSIKKTVSTFQNYRNELESLALKKTKLVFVEKLKSTKP